MIPCLTSFTRLLSRSFRRPMSYISLRNSPPVTRARISPGSPIIRLTDLENKLCSLIEDFTQQLRLESQHVTCYIAGGWVRDKLLGLDSNDIDIALSSMMGFPFAVKFAEYLERREIKVTRVTKVESRADQSKHLETAKVVVLGLELDFVNLRSEEYAQDSRIPTKVKFGTPLEDTLRRDITINALLYNIHSRSVEDHTDKGLEDLRDGIVRTPLPPRQTFLDDPLRVLRCVRFASRYGYDLVPELKDAARDREIQAALEAKIARERIGDEVDKMMKGANPLRAIQLIDELALHPSVFDPPRTTSIPVPDDIPHHYALASASIFHHFIHPSDASQRATPESCDHISSSINSLQLPLPHPTLLRYVLASPSSQRQFFMASAFAPYRELIYQEKKRKKPFIEACIREGLKLGLQNHYLDGIPALFAASALLRQPRLEKFDSSPRVALGLLLRNKSVHNPMTETHWKVSVLFSLVQELVPLWDPVADRLDVDAATEIVALYTTFVNRVEELDLQSSLESPPILDGREISSLLDKRPGKWMGCVLAQIIEWQLENPQGSKEECAAWLTSGVNAGRIITDNDPIGDKQDGDARRHKKPKLS